MSKWLEAGGTREQFDALIADAKPWTPGSTPIEHLILTSAQFVAAYVPPDYLIDGILQKQFLYALTGQTNAGKTAIALHFAASVALGKKIGSHEVEPGKVLYFAGENPTDIQGRWIAMSQRMDFDADTLFHGSQVPVNRFEVPPPGRRCLQKLDHLFNGLRVTRGVEPEPLPA